MSPLCLTCVIPLCPTVEKGEAPGNSFWCAKCGQSFDRIEKIRSHHVALVHQNLARPSTLRWEGKVLPDGAVNIACAGIGSAAEAREAGFALLHLAGEAERRLERLAGTDRWSFRRTEAGFEARIHGESCALVPWTSGGRRPNCHGHTLPDQRCNACSASLPKGARGYRSDTGTSRGRFDASARFCSKCVEAAPGARPALTVVHGGKDRAG